MPDLRAGLSRTGFDDDQVNAILDRAGDLQIAADGSLDLTSQELLEESAEEAGIDRALVREAVRQLQAEWQAEQKAERRERQARRQLGVGIGVVLAVVVVGGLVGQAGRRAETETRRGQVVRLQGELEAARAQLDNVLQRRREMVPRLVAASSGQSPAARDHAERLRQLALRYDDASGANRPRLEQELARELSRLTDALAATAAPGSVNRGLMDELAGTENRIAVERKRYNEVAVRYNQAVRRLREQAPSAAADFPSAPIGG